MKLTDKQKRTSIKTSTDRYVAKFFIQAWQIHLSLRRTKSKDEPGTYADTYRDHAYKRAIITYYLPTIFSHKQIDYITRHECAHIVNAPIDALIERMLDVMEEHKIDVSELKYQYHVKRETVAEHWARITEDKASTKGVNK